MPKTILEFVGDASGLKPAIEVLESIGDVTDKQVAKFNKVNDAYARRTNEVKKQTTESKKLTQETNKQLESISKGLKNIPKTIASGAIKETAKSIKQMGESAEVSASKLKKAQAELRNIQTEITQLDRINNEFKIELLQQETALAKVGKGWSINGLKIKRSIKGLNSAIKDNNLALRKMRIEERDSKQTIQSLKKQESALSSNIKEAERLTTEYRKLKDEISRLDEGSDQFNSMVEEAAMLELQIQKTNERVKILASTTLELDAALDVISGMAAAYSIAQGAAAILGSENEDLQKALLKVNAAMAVLQGLQTAQNFLARQSAIGTLLQTGASKALTLQKYLETGAESKNIVVKWASVAASKALNTVMKANPILLFIGLLAAAAVAFVAFSSKAKDATEELIKLNKVEESLIKTQQNIIKGRRVLVEYMREFSNAGVKRLEQEMAQMKLAGASQVELLNQQRKIDEERFRGANEAYKTNAGLIDRLIGTEAKRAATLKKIQVEEQNLIDLSTQRLEVEGSIIKGPKGLAEGREKAVKLTEAQIAKQQALVDKLKEEYDLALDIVDTRDEAEQTLFENEKERQRIITELILRDAIAVNERKAIEAKRSSKAELNAKIAVLENKLQLELQHEGLLASERKKLQAQTEKEIQDLKDEFNFEQQRIELANQTNNTKIKLAAVREGSKQELELKKELLDTEREQQISNVKQQIEDEKELASAIERIKAESVRQKLQLEADYIKGKRQLQQQEIDADAEHERAQYDLVVNRLNATTRERYAASQNAYDVELDRLTKQQELLDEHYEELGLSDQEYFEERRRLGDEMRAVEQQKENEHLQKQKEIRQQVVAASFDFINEFASQMLAAGTEARNRKYEEDLAALEEQKEKVLSNEELSDTQRLALEKRFQKEAAAIKLEAWKADQAAKAAQAGINGFLGATRAIAEIPPPAGLIAAASAIAFAALQAGNIQRQKPPKFAKGTKSAPGGMAWVGEEGPELMHVPRGAKIITHPESMAIMQKYEIPVINNAASKISKPVISDDLYSAAQRSIPTQERLDYNKLGKVFAKEIGKQPKVAINIDEGGFVTHIQEDAHKRTYLGTKYNSR